ncbi:hypothetical protein NIES4075_49140 [Tolypothrix sp. NIES-4075]|nr:hypothetical protein NIES4075_49140 [Tolypothrix sp. NIES-4075]
MLSLNLNGRRVKAKYYWAQKMIFYHFLRQPMIFMGNNHKESEISPLNRFNRVNVPLSTTIKAPNPISTKGINLLP